MILTKDNDDAMIITAIQNSGLDCYDGKTGMVFSVSPCENCGSPVLLPNHLTIEAPSDKVHRLLTDTMQDIQYAEFVGYDDNGEECCDACTD